MQKERIETPRLFLGKAAPADTQALYDNLWSQEESARYMLWQPVGSMEEAQERMKRTIEFQKDHLAYTVYEKASRQAIGFAGIVEIADKVYEDTGIAVGPQFVRRGYGKEILNALVKYCFDELGAVKMVCSCRSQNTASRNLQLSCGFRYSHSELRTDRRNGTDYTVEFYELHNGKQPEN